MIFIPCLSSLLFFQSSMILIWRFLNFNSFFPVHCFPFCGWRVSGINIWFDFARQDRPKFLQICWSIGEVCLCCSYTSIRSIIAVVAEVVVCPFPGVWLCINMQKNEILWWVCCTLFFSCPKLVGNMLCYC